MPKELKKKVLQKTVRKSLLRNLKIISEWIFIDIVREIAEGRLKGIREAVSEENLKKCKGIFKAVTKGIAETCLDKTILKKFPEKKNQRYLFDKFSEELSMKFLKIVLKQVWKELSKILKKKLPQSFQKYH